MPREFSRSQRMAEQLRRELAEIVRDEIKDPRLGFVSFTEVRMSRDLSHAVIYCSFFNADINSGFNADSSTTSSAESNDLGQDKSGQNSHQQSRESIDVLNRAVGFIRKAVARRIQARIVPTLKFTIDESVVRGAAMDDLINKAIQGDNSRKQNVDIDAEVTDESDTKSESN